MPLVSDTSAIYGLDFIPYLIFLFINYLDTFRFDIIDLVG
jgi:hypothetical protein